LEELRRRLANYIRIDQVNVRVEGPFPVRGDDSLVMYRLTICGDFNVDEDSAANDLIDRVNSGDEGDIGIKSAELGDLTETSSATQLAVAFVLYFLAFF
jgi:hypothetical protein